MEENVEYCEIKPSENVAEFGFSSLKLEKFELIHNDGIIYLGEYESNGKSKDWATITHLVEWSTEFINKLRSNRQQLAALELLKGNTGDVPFTVANYYVSEAISIIESAVCFDFGVPMIHPDTKFGTRAIENILVEDTNSIQEILRQVFMCLFSECSVRLVVKSNQFCTSVLSTYLVELMHSCGATNNEIRVLANKRRESSDSFRLSKTIQSNRLSSMSVVAIVFAKTDTFAAAQGILDAYFREMYPNLIVFVEEAAYANFVRDWQRYYSHALVIGPRLDPKTMVTEALNGKLRIDLTAIDVRAAHKIAGNVINMIRFRNLAELISLLSNLRKIPFMSLWHDDSLLLRDLCIDINSCTHFWLRHLPCAPAGRRFGNDIIDNYGDWLSQTNVNIYNSLNFKFNEEIENLRKLQTSFMRKDIRLRHKLVLGAYISVISKCKSLRNGNSVTNSVTKLRRFVEQVHNLNDLSPGDSRIESLAKPVGLALLHVVANNSSSGAPPGHGNNLVVGDEVDKDKAGSATMRLKYQLTDFVFKNLLLGNAVLVCCPSNTFGARFNVENDHIIPFKMVSDSSGLPDISRLSLDASINLNEACKSVGACAKKQCPKNTYAVEVSLNCPNNGDYLEAMLMSLGTRRRFIWYPDAIQTDYWTDV